MEQRISPAAREQVIEVLGEHFSRDHLTLDEYERRVEQAYRAPNADALMALTHDLAPLAPVRVNAVPGPIARDTAPGPVAASAPPRKRFFALMSGVLRRGQWVVPARIEAFACMGGIDMDLREATLTAPVTDIYVLAIMGGVKITVPAGVRLQSDGFAIMGGFGDRLLEPEASNDDTPLVRVHGVAVMGGVETKVVDG